MSQLDEWIRGGKNAWKVFKLSTPKLFNGFEESGVVPFHEAPVMVL